MEDRVILVWFDYADSPQCDCLALVMTLTSSWYQGGTLSQREMFALILAERRRERILPVSVDSQWPSAQNNHYDKVAYFGVAYPDPL